MNTIQYNLNNSFYALEERFNKEEIAIDNIEQEMIRAALENDIDYIQYLVQERKRHIKLINKHYLQLEKISDLMEALEILTPYAL